MNIVVLTGAGISAESGIRTFRDAGGLWEDMAIEDVATPQAFARDPNLVYQFYNARRQQLQDDGINPNDAHYALVELSALPQVNLTVVTQNVDNLHEQAGSHSVIHMHGELLSARCTRTEQRVPWLGHLDGTHRCQCCSPAQRLRPDIVWFGEIPMHMDTIHRALFEADLFVAIGTSGAVYPAAGFVDIAQQYGAKTLLINLEDTNDNGFEQTLIGNASECVPKWVQSIKDGYELE